MRSRARTGLLLLAVVSVLSAAYLSFTIERRTQSVVATARSYDTRIGTAIRQTFDLRSAQQAYVSQGQPEKYWITKVSAAASALRESLTSVKAASTTAASRVAIEGAGQALQEFERMDKRAREYASSSQKLVASDLIFSDGLESTEEIITALEQARYVEHADADSTRSAGRRDQAIFAGAAAAIALLVIVLLLPAPIESADRTSEAVASPESIPAPPLPVAAEEFEFRPLARPAGVTPVDAAAPESITPASEANAEVPSPALSADLAPDVSAIAEVCKELARLADTTALPPLLERAATALDASGVMLWVADPDARQLTAVAAHGYPRHVLSRIGTIAKDAENVTAAAFRTGLLQTLEADETSPAAIAAPLVNPSGCIGVMSAEVGKDVERQPARLALATIVAAQLATLVAPAARAHSKSEAV
jgi:hypothetical protein